MGKLRDNALERWERLATTMRKQKREMQGWAGGQGRHLVACEAEPEEGGERGCREVALREAQHVLQHALVDDHLHAWSRRVHLVRGEGRDLSG